MRDVIARGLDELGLTPVIPPGAAQALAEYGRLLLEGNRVMNLTAIREEEAVARLHMLDCAALLARWELPGQRLIDVGTGAGFPGLVLKILCPTLELTLLDGLEKRLDWLSSVCRALGVEGVTFLHTRGEEQALLPEHRDAYDVATARAVARLNLLGELCLPFVRPGGRFLAMKGPDCDSEVAQAAGCFHALSARLEACWDYTVPGGPVHRVVSVVKEGPTPTGYPRRWARMQKNPL